MKIEREKIIFTDISLQSEPDGSGLLVDNVHQHSYKLSSLQSSYLSVLKNNSSIEELVQFFLGQGWLVNFRELYALIEFLTTRDLILNKSFKDYFVRMQPQAEGQLAQLWHSWVQGTTAPKSLTSTDPSQLPFFRTLPIDTAKYLLQKSEKIKIPAHTKILQAGSSERDLYVLLSGQVALYRPLAGNQRQLLTVLEPGSLFGERGFLLAQPRSADVWSVENSEVLRVRHLPEFDQVIKSDKAQALHHRFWVMQALMASPFFKNIPTDTLDALIFTGKILKAHENQLLFQEGTPGKSCFILIQGNAVVSQKGKAINVMNAGTCFGEIALFNGGLRTATVTTQRESLVLEIQQESFYRMLGQNIVLAKELENLAAERLQKDANRK